MATETTQAEPSAVESQFLDIVRELLREMGRPEVAESAAVSSSFERDLGIGSLDLVELMVRCEGHFEVELPDHIAEEAETPAAWIKAILEGGQEAEAASAYRISPPPTESPAEPVSAKTLVDVLAGHAENDPGRVHIHLLEADSGQGITYGKLYDEASAVASGLAEQGLRRNETVAIMLPTGADFFYAFFGVMLAGGIPVPVYPPTRPDRIEDYVRRQIEMMRNTGVRFLISFDQVQAIVQILRVNLPSLADVTTVDALRQSKGRLGVGSVRPAEIALLQFTSGSTGIPKAVTLTNANVLANIRGIGAAVEVRPGDALVSWLPLYSDLGMVGCWLFSLYYGTPLTVLSPLDFLRRPERWLRAIADARGTLSAAPNFAYDLCARRIPAWTLEGIDLSSWRVAVNGGEPVLPETIERFTKRFSGYGFRAEAFQSCYGLSESTVALTMPPPERLPVRDRIDKHKFETENRAEPAGQNGEPALIFFTCGKPIEGQQIRLVDESGAEVPERTVGRVLFRGDSTMSGYYREPEATAAVTMDGGWTDTGDYGYIANGEFYFTGRMQDSIEKAGRSMSPLNVESALNSVPGVLPGTAVAFGVTESDSTTEQLVVAAETRAANQVDFRRIETEITRVVDNYLGVPPDKIQLVEPGALPRTSNGKVRRNDIRSLYLKRRLRVAARPPWMQIVRLRWENLGALIGLALRRARNSTGRALTKAAVSAGARVGGIWVRLTHSGGVVRSVARWALGLQARRYSIQGLPNLDSGKPALLVVNRPGTLDPLVAIATLPGTVWFADISALDGLPPALAFLLEPLVLSDTAAAKTGTIRERVAKALQDPCTVVVFPESPIGTAIPRCRYRLDPFRAALETGAAIHPTAVRERAQQQQPVERARIRKVTMLIVREPMPAEQHQPPDLMDLRERVRQAIGDYHA